MEEYRIDLKVRNNLIIKKIENAGYSSLGEFCRLNGIMKYVSNLGDVVNMKKSPLNSKGEFLNCIKHMADILACAPEDLFSDIQMHSVLKTNKRTVEVNEAEMKFMLEQSNNTSKLLEDHYSDEQRDYAVEKMLETLTPKEQKIIEMRMGLGEYDREHTLKEIGDGMGVGMERIRQIEARALRKLRHPLRSDGLREYIET